MVDPSRARTTLGDLGRADPISEHIQRTGTRGPHPRDRGARRYPRVSVRPSPARARPHDPDAWLPLPDVEALPALPPGASRIRARMHIGGDVRPVPGRRVPSVRPSPARARPHDPDAWFPTLAFEAALETDALVDSGQTAAIAVADPVPGSAVEPGRPHRRGLRATVGRRRLAAGVAIGVALVAVTARVATAGLWGPGDPEVRLRVDDRVLTPTTDAGTVGELLTDEHVRLRRDDRVVPRASTGISDGLVITVHRAFGVNVDFDGSLATVRTTHRRPGALLRELGLDPARVAVKSAPQRLGRGGTVVFRTRHDATIQVDGTTQLQTSLALTVDEFLTENAVVLGPLDQLTPARETRLADGMVVTVVRVFTDTVTADEPLQFTVERREDPSFPKGQERVGQEGVNGVQRVTYQRTMADGVEVERAPISKVPIQPPVPRIVLVGTALPNSRTGTASWYASPFGPDSCATKPDVPMGTVVRVTNLDTGASTSCRVADRVEANRVVDLDDDVFEQLSPVHRGVFDARIDW